jgi:uncharacterized protein
MAKKLILMTFLITLQILYLQSQSNKFYITNQAPLINQPYTALPLGAIKPQGWLLKMLEIQRDGLTGHLDSIYSVVCGDNNGWLGGTGDGWERGPYWIDGLVPLAYILDDKALINKAKKWIEWSIASQGTDGNFGPKELPEGYEKIPGTQQGQRNDWWPRMVMLKVLQQYYTATADKRVITLLTNYFRYQLKELPAKPLGFVTFWGEQRGGDNLQVVYWLYNITKEPFLLELGELINKQTFPWKTVYTDGRLNCVNPYPSLHCVNVAQGVKTPAIYYQQDKDSMLLKSIKTGLKSLREVHGFANGMYGGDERLHGNNPTQGSELCSAVELMYSLESILPITGDLYYADYLEKLAFNVLPTQHDDAFMNRQYFQQPNQIKMTYDTRNFYNDGYGRVVYGLLTGYPCCTANMHQGWPKFVQNLWYATSDNGLAVLVYGASTVTAKVADGRKVSFSEETNYPFEEEIRFICLSADKVEFGLSFRIPSWCEKAKIQINGQLQGEYKSGTIAKLNRVWNTGDKVLLSLPMHIEISRWAENSAAVEHGPLLYALRIEEKWQQKTNADFKEPFYEILPGSPWNYGLTSSAIRTGKFEILRKKTVPLMPWNLENAPVSLKTIGKSIPQWQEFNFSAGPLPISEVRVDKNIPEEEIVLIPYGCSTLRISEFPVIQNSR